MKKQFLISAIVMLVLCVGTNALAWGSTTPPTSTNTGTLTNTGTVVGFGTNGIKSSIDTNKCYTGIGVYKVKASGLYLANDSPKQCTVKLGVDYWSNTDNDWKKGGRYTKTLPATNVKDGNGNYYPSKQSISSQDINAQATNYYHYGKFTKDYTSIKMYGSFTLHK